MKIVYASRSGNVEKFVEKLGVTDAMKVKLGTETIDEDYIIITYTDGSGIVPPIVETFLNYNSDHVRAVACSGDNDRHPDTFCFAANVIAEKYGVPVVETFHKDGDDVNVKKVKAFLDEN